MSDRCIGLINTGAMRNIREDIKNNRFKRTYLLFGEERFLVNEYKHKLLHALVREGDNINFTKFSGNDIRWEEIVDISETLPFMAEHRVVLVEDSGFFNMSADKLASFPGYITSIPDTTVIIFSEMSVDKRGKLYKELSKDGYACEIKKQDKDDLTRWILGKLKAEGKNITRAATEEFFERLGNDMGLLSNEFEKLICYTADKEVIDEKDVREICIRSLEDQVFDMLNCMCMSDKQKAFELYMEMDRLDVPPERTFILLMKEYRKLLYIKSLERSSVPESEYPGRLNMSPYAIKKYRERTARLSMGRLKKILNYGVEETGKLRMGLLDRRMALELFINFASSKEVDS